MPEFNSIRAYLQSEFFAISDAGMTRIEAILEARERGLPGDTGLAAEIRAARADRMAAQQPSAVAQRIALIPMHGTIAHRAGSGMETSGMVSPQWFASNMRALADDPEFASIVIDTDSPGGTVAGTAEAAEAVAYARSKKPVIAIANEQMTSAAYWIASHATRVIATPGAIVGSIGVISGVGSRAAKNEKDGIDVRIIRSVDQKALGNPDEAITDAAIASVRSKVDAYHAQFVNAIAAARGVSLNTANSWATGETWLGEDAMKNGLIDGLGNLETAIQWAASAAQGSNPKASAGKGFKMTDEQLKAEHPELSEALIAKGASASDNSVIALKAEIDALKATQTRGARMSIAQTALVNADLVKVGVVNGVDYDARFSLSLEQAAITAESDDSAIAAVNALIVERKALTGGSRAVESVMPSGGLDALLMGGVDASGGIGNDGGGLGLNGLI
ncbi:MAG: S49 family peptidase [Casimicrobium sp.]